MKFKSVHYPSGTIVRWKERPKSPLRKILLIVGFLFLTNLMTYFAFRPEKLVAHDRVGEDVSQAHLFLINEARPFLYDEDLFTRGIQAMAQNLGVPTSWIMAVIYSESKFNSRVFNYKGSGAVGLIQFMPETARELGISSLELSQMSPSQQLPYVQAYFEKVRERYGPYKGLADFYLAVLYPKARQQDPCYALYAKPSKAYRQNSGLDENRDGIVTVSDIDLRMKRLFPQAYIDS